MINKDDVFLVSCRSHVTYSSLNEQDGGQCCTAVVAPAVQFDSFKINGTLLQTFRLHFYISASPK